MTAEPELFEFQPDVTDEVVARMQSLFEAGSGWLNLQPGFDPDDVPPPRSDLAMLITASGPDVPLCTWAPATGRQRGGVSIGIQHNAGRRANNTLRDRGVPVPQGWRVTQDHPRRGLVVEVPAPHAADHARVLTWLLNAALALTDVPLSGMWRAAIYEIG